MRMMSNAAAYDVEEEDGDQYTLLTYKIKVEEDQCLSPTAFNAEGQHGDQ